MKILDQLIDSYKDAMITDIQALVQIKSVREESHGDFPFGMGVQTSLEKALEIAARLGFHTENIDNYAGEASFGDGQESVAMLGHLDVVPEGNGWTYPPYGGELHDGVIYGRGVSDNKGPSIMGLYAIKALVESDLPISKQLKMVFGTNEESGMVGIRYYADKKGAPTMSIVPDAVFPVVQGEKGIMSFKLKSSAHDHILKPGTVIVTGSGGNAVNSVPDICTIKLTTDDRASLLNILEKYHEYEDYHYEWEELDQGTFIITTHGLSSHGSMPQNGRNAVTYMFSLLGAFAPADASPIAEFIHLYNAKIAFEHYGEGIGCGFNDQESGTLAFNPGLFAITEAGIEIAINIRYPVTFTANDVYNGIEQELQGTAIVLERGRDSSPIYFPADHPLVNTLMTIYQAQTGDTESRPVVLGGGTYARCLPNAVPFGAGFKWSNGNAHKPDEQLKVEDMLLATKIYAEALYRLAK